ncbi:MAG: LysM peptidoglycan-binding domain-containing protein [Vicinamibacterales bacterium]
MSLTTKYAALIAQIQSIGVKDLKVAEAGGKLQISGSTEYQMQKDLIWDAVKALPGWEQELQVDLRPEKTDIWGIWEVKPGDSLSKIAKSAYDNAGAYMQIFNANTNTLKDPNLIKPGQKLVIPNP